MALADFGSFAYNPILAVRLSELTALQELPPADKDKILPSILLRQWSGSHRLESSIQKISAVFQDRPVIIMLPDELDTPKTVYEVHRDLERLASSANGYRNWVDFIEGNPLYIPTAQLIDINQFSAQIANLSELNRGIVIHLDENSLLGLNFIAQEVSRLYKGEDVLFQIDYKQKNRELLLKALSTVNITKYLREAVPNCYVSASATTFPMSFAKMSSQSIFERRFYEIITESLGQDFLVYSDHGSARSEQMDRIITNAPVRIDNPTRSEWFFFKEKIDYSGIDPDEDEEEARRECRTLGYTEAAKQAVESDSWADLGIWGTNQILEQAEGVPVIKGQGQAATVRINIHLHLQCGAGALDSEEPWTD